MFQICVMARLSQSLILGAYTNKLHPENTYVLATAASGWKLLEKMWGESENRLLDRWKSVATTISQNNH